MHHILSACKQALAQGRYTWRHNNVLRELANAVESRRKIAVEKKVSKRKWISYTKEGVKPVLQKSEQSSVSYFDSAVDWELLVDLEKKLKIPQFIAETTKRPDLIIYSKATKCIGMVELTVPYEDRMEVANELKRSKYEELRQACERNNWKTRIWPVEVGARGFVGFTAAQVLKELGITGRKRTDCIKKMSSEAERCSRVLWNMHRVPQWGHQRS